MTWSQSLYHELCTALFRLHCLNVLRSWKAAKWSGKRSSCLWKLLIACPRKVRNAASCQDVQVKGCLISSRCFAMLHFYMLLTGEDQTCDCGSVRPPHHPANAKKKVRGESFPYSNFVG